MNKQELQNEINKTKEHLATMEKMLAECEYERWKPKQDNFYWFVDTYLKVINDYWFGSCDERELYNAYNCFQTREQAEAEAEKILVRRMLEDIARRLNKGEKIDWNEESQPKYFIEYVTSDDKLEYDSSSLFKNEGTVYCLDSNFYDVTIQEIGEERLKKYLRGE